MLYPSTLLAKPIHRGERNNNPLNLDRGTPPIPWLGLAVDQSQDDRFAVFVDPQHGIRAAILNMQTHALRSTSTYKIALESLVEIWAPPSENDTRAYLLDVSWHTNLATGSTVDTSLPADVCVLVPGFIWHENGRNIYPPSMVIDALNMLPAAKVA